MKRPKLNIKLPKLLRIDPFGNLLFIKRALIGLLGAATYPRFNIVNKLHVEGREFLKQLPPRNVLFLSNHQTYYADVMSFYHIFSSVKWNLEKTKMPLPLYLLLPRVNSYYVAAEETMKQSGFLPKIFSYTGAVTVKRSWRSAGKEVVRGADAKAPDKIRKALQYGWVVNFPQGTTAPYAPIRKGTAHLIKELRPLIVPIVIDGFSEAFDKRGLKIKNKGTKLTVRFKEPLMFDESMTIPEIQQKIAELIEQIPENQSKANIEE